ncbi:host specificity factor TipJ family phage tail protein [Sodalis sp. RH21]|uniref:host specificity factor TipJ family phage tail protein n=1 Tax=unclassified Sodalis (in: enterobacteria) TaxID=2636512 RepID=UPI0039B3CE11
MTIRIYPSRLPGEPLETHEHGCMTLHQWFMKNVTDYKNDMRHPIAVEVNGRSVPANDWPLRQISPGDDIRIYPVPYGIELGIAGWIAVAVAAVSVAYSLFMMSNLGAGGYSSPGSGSSLELNPAKANQAKLGDPIREVFGKRRIWPDYLVSPVGRFDPNDPEKFTMHLFVSLGVGRFSFSNGDVRVGDTPIGSLDADFNYVTYTPGANVAGDERTENWYLSTEVGGTTSGIGLDMGTTAPETDDILADGVNVNGSSVSFVGVTADDDDSSDNDDNALPESWVVGSTLVLIIPDSYAVTTGGLYSIITGNNLAEIVPYVGMPITLTYNSINYNLFIASYTPHSETTDEVTGETTIVTASITLAYNNAAGAAFSGIPDGIQRLAISHVGSEYKILTIDGTTITVVRLLSGEEENTWPGFANRSVLDFTATGINDSDTWLGPFLVCPENETTDCFELNFSFPSGICGFNSKGSKKSRTVKIELQFRVYGSGAGWTSKSISYENKSINGLGYTERITLTEPALAEVRVRRTNEQGEDNSRDNAYWQALRSRLSSRPASYTDITTMAVSVVTGGKLAAQSDRRINVVATRDYDTGTARTISGALYHVLLSLGFTPAQIDIASIDSLETNYWTPREEYFDFSADGDSTSALDILQKITNAGMGYFLLSDGLASAGREGVKNWTGIISPQETTEALQTAFSAPSQDDYDGVNVTYINGTTWAEETVQCRMPDNPTPSKIEDYTLDGVLDPDRAYRIGMRRLLKYQRQRLTHTTTTELDALCYQYGDRLVLTDDIPGNMTISSLITGISTSGGVTTFTVSEPLDWTFSNPRVLIRYQDGSASPLLVATQFGEYQLRVPHAADFDSIILDDPYIEPPRLIFCSSSRVGYDAIISEIAPSSDGTCQVKAGEYSSAFYDYDDALYPGDVS